MENLVTTAVKLRNDHLMLMVVGPLILLAVSYWTW